MNNVEYRNTLYEVNEVFGILDKSLVEKNYQAKDFHTMYIAEIEKVLMAN